MLLVRSMVPSRSSLKQVGKGLSTAFPGCTSPALKWQGAKRRPENVYQAEQIALIALL
jgi:hypothetical protein